MRNWCAIEDSTSNRTPSVYRDTGSAIRMTGTMMPRCGSRGMLTFICRSMGMRIRWPTSTRFVWTCTAISNSGEAFVKDGFPFMQGLDYRGYVWLKSADYVGKVVVTLEADQTGGEQYASAVLPEIAGDWKKYSFTLKPSKSDPLAKIAILFQGNGRLWLDQVSLLPGDAQGRSSPRR